MPKLVSESLDNFIKEYTPQYVKDPEIAPKKTREGEETKWRVFVFEHPLNINQNRQPKFVYTYSPELYDSIRNREEEVYFEGKIVPAIKHGNLVPYGEITKRSSRTKIKPWFTWDEWKGRDKFGNYKDNPETKYIQRNGIPFSSFIN